MPALGNLVSVYQKTRTEPHLVYMSTPPTSAGKRNNPFLALTLRNLADLGNTLVQKGDMSPTLTVRRQRLSVGDNRMPRDWWDIVWDALFCGTLCEDPSLVDVDKLSKESDNEAHEILSVAIKECDFSKAAIHMVSIHKFQALLTGIDHTLHQVQIYNPRPFRWIGSWSHT